MGTMQTAKVRETQRERSQKAHADNVKVRPMALSLRLLRLT